MVDDFQRVVVDFNIWQLLPRQDKNALLVIARDESRSQVICFDLKLEDGGLVPADLNVPWWGSVLGASGDGIYTVEYADQHDPNRKSFFLHSIGKKQEIFELPDLNDPTLHPSLYESGSAYHITVAEFLGLELPLPCEYLELGDKIIISYYLRSKDASDRYLLILEDGKKVFKTRQDSGMKGFAAGSFFVYHNWIIFVKDRNEIWYNHI